MNILCTKDISKRYTNNVLANDGVSIEIPQNKITAIIGENGAGKTTLMNILYGAVQPDNGRIFLSGKQVKLKSPRVAIEYGIGMVSQHFMLLPSLTVAENVFLGNEPSKRIISFDFQNACDEIKRYADTYNLKVCPEAYIKDLSVGEKQKVEILKLLVRKAEIFIFDEPTAALTDDECQMFYDIIKKVIKNGKTVIIVTHRVAETLHYADKLIVMKSGRVVGDFNRDEIVGSEVITDLMFEHSTYDNKIPIHDNKSEEIIYELNSINYINASGKRILNDISFQVKKGRIIGIVGVEDCGLDELAKIMFGLLSAESGDVFFLGEKVRPGISRQKGLSFIPEDRMEYAVSLDCTVKDNLLSPVLLKSIPYRNRKKIDRIALEIVNNYGIACESIYQKVRELSGGNIQKVVVAREFSFEPKLVIASQITRGVDMRSSSLIYEKIHELACNGTAFVILSSDVNEIKEIADEIIVLYDGGIRIMVKNTEEIDTFFLKRHTVGLK